MEDNILKELDAVKEWLNHPCVGEKLKEAGVSAMFTTATKYGECETCGYTTPSGIENITKCIIHAGMDSFDGDNCCTYISEIVDFIDGYFEDNDEDEEDGNEEDNGFEGVTA